MNKLVTFILLALAGVGVWLHLTGRLPLDRVGGTSAPVGPAMHEAWVRVSQNPRNPDAWAALGDAEAARGELEAAEHAYRTAIRLGGGDGLAYARLGFLLYEQGNDKAALEKLNTARRRGADVPMLEYTIAQLESRVGAPAERPRAVPTPPVTSPVPAPSSFEADAGVSAPVVEEPEPIAEAPPERNAPVIAEPPPSPEPLSDICTVKMHKRRGSGSYRVYIAFGDQDAELIVDTGATMTVLAGHFVRRTGVRPDRGRSITALTANGKTRFATAVMDEIVLAERVVDRSRVAICEDCGVEKTSDGLLGLDLQAAFGMELDLSRGLIRFADCR